MIRVHTNAEPEDAPFVVAARRRAEDLLRHFRQVALTDRLRFPRVDVEVFRAPPRDSLPVVFLGSGEVWEDNDLIVTVNAACGSGATPILCAEETEVLDGGGYRHTRRVEAFVVTEGMPLKTWCTTPTIGETNAFFAKLVRGQVRAISRTEWLDLQEQWESERMHAHAGLLTRLAKRVDRADREHVAVDLAAYRGRAATASDRRLADAVLRELGSGSRNES
jgi:hypothetical protein